MTKPQRAALVNYVSAATAPLDLARLNRKIGRIITTI
jgi:hypothetical protein